MTEQLASKPLLERWKRPLSQQVGRSEAAILSTGLGMPAVLTSTNS